MDYRIKYKAYNTYDVSMMEALWQFLIAPQDNDTQRLEYALFNNSLNVLVEESVNGFGFKTYRVHPKKPFQKITFEAEFRLNKTKINPFEKVGTLDIEGDNKLLQSLEFRTEHEPFLKCTALTRLPRQGSPLFNFNDSLSVFDNLIALNCWVYEQFEFKANVTTVDTLLEEVLSLKQGVCQDFTHLFCALARKNGIPARYVSGYLHQGQNYLGDSQMHAWAACCIPRMGWVGFDPTNNLLCAENHIKVSHGKDYTDCPPIKGILYSSGHQETIYTVTVRAMDNGPVMSQSMGDDGIMEQHMGTMVQQLNAPAQIRPDHIMEQQQQ